jgi:hypothetical protein
VRSCTLVPGHNSTRNSTTLSEARQKRNSIVGLATGRGVHTEQHSVEDEEVALDGTYRPSPAPAEDEDDDYRSTY